ncbi:MAG: response regulator [Isosphaeraceae bacterium]
MHVLRQAPHDALLVEFAGSVVERQVLHLARLIDDLAQSRPFDVVLLDIGLPEIDGHEVARRIRNRTGVEQPMLVGISGYGFDADHRRARDSGFDLYLVKPVDPEQLEGQLVALVASRRRTDESGGGEISPPR